MTDEGGQGICSDERRVATAEPPPAPTRHGSRKPRHRLHAVGAVAMAGLLLAACGDDGPATESTNTMERSDTVVALGTDRLVFEPDEFTITAGQEATLELTSGSVEHDFVVEGAAEFGASEADDPGDEPEDLHVAHADPGETVTATFTIDEAGTYTVYCSIPGHRDAGMVASLQVINA